MSEFKITRFRYNWRGDWEGSDSSTYFRDDVVNYQGQSWVCLRQHQPTIFAQDQSFIPPGNTLPSPAWRQMTGGREFLGQWQPNIIYDRDALVSSGGNLYLCINTHTGGTNFSDNILDWEIYAVGSNWDNQWQENYRYRVGDIVRYNGVTYQCILEHTASSESLGIVVGDYDGFDDSTAETWKIVASNYQYRGNFSTNTRYRKNDLVKYGGSVLRCTEEHTSSSISGLIDNNKFTTYLSGYKFQDQWTAVYYAVGDVVRRGGTLYVAVQNNYNSIPGRSTSDVDGVDFSNWLPIVNATNFRGQYDSEATYFKGDLVRRGGSLYVANRNILPSDDSTLIFLNDDDWQSVIEGQGFRGPWAASVLYGVNDLVYFQGSTWKSNFIHTSSISNFPGDNGEGINYWDLLVSGDPNAALLNLGDLITFNLSRSVVGDTSTLGNVPIPIGNEDQLLYVEDDTGSIGYKVWGNTPRVIYVATTGIDDTSDPYRGYNYFKPFRTLRFALDYVDDGFEGLTTIFLRTGEYQEILPLIIPRNTVVSGDELRSASVRANDPIPALAEDTAKTLAALIRLGLILPSIVQGLPIQKSTGNTADQTLLSAATNVEAALVDGMITDITRVINFKVNNTGTYPTVSGSNTASTDTNILYAIDNINANRIFLANEAIIRVQTLFPTYVFDDTLCRRDIDKYLDAVVYDLTYSGNYKSVLAGRYYANAVIGSQLEDMFYVRDTTGLRNLTLRGLEGELPALQEGQIYRFPTGGAFVSLDPGWGPNDERVWITNRSHYVQNVTTFGTGAVGQKVDGALHNGGNRSIVSNDFTQVISDGIGAWIQNGGRAELVSVFTYYAHIGMFAKDGGIIRATNGNSSYGDFGAIADGLDLNETPQIAQLNTRIGQALVASAFAGEVNDFILSLEFTNCGQEYSEATYTITSSGTGAVALQEEFRDNSMFVCNILSSGSGFNQYGNQAQLGTNTTITLATAETVSAANILGMRIILTSGEGTGQYGYVQAYNPSTKVVTVYRESDNQPGWDHIIPGFPDAILTTGTRYRIEPRPIFSAPPFETLEVDIGFNGTWAAAIYGETSGTFSNISGSGGSGGTIDVLPLAAEFSVEKIGRSYTVTMTNPGAGYAAGDTIILDGSTVGGISVEHDITLEVLSTTEDSTNSIVAFEIIGDPIADSGKFILTPQSGRVSIVSSDGSNWSNVDLPQDGQWKCLASGDNIFVAIANNSSIAASSSDGITWTQRAMPSSRNWNSVAYGGGVFLAVASNLNSAAYSVDGVIWAAVTLPTAGDSTLNEWVDVAYGQGRFIVLANSNNIVADGSYDADTDSWSWSWHFMDVIADSSQKDWVSIAYGNRRWVSISSTGDVGYSFEGSVWYPADMPKQDGSTIHNWRQVRYGQGVFFAIGDTGGRTVGGDPTSGPTTYAVTSYDGIVWENRELTRQENWRVVAFGNPDVTLGDSTVSNSKPTFVIAPGSTSSYVNRVYTGAKILGRATVEGVGIGRINIWEPGSGYVQDPTLTVVDPGKTIDPEIRPRLADGVLAQPTFTNKGQAYKTSTTRVTISGDGFADVTPTDFFITLDGLSVMPGPGAQFYIGGREGFFTAVIVGIDESTAPDGSIRSTFRISPRPTLRDYLEHNMEVVIREKYSQVRITGHDFLDIGTGNFEETNYPELYSNYEFTTEPFQEVLNLNGGRVFYTSTDQNGNFRAGDLFAVEQATGIITISADFFDLAGLTELRLGGITVGSTAVVREFSKDPLFLQDSNSVIPTQRAIRAYLQSRLNIGGEDLLTPSFIAGTVRVGPNLINSTAGLTVLFPVMADFSGDGCGVSGSYLAQTMFFRSFNRE